MNTSRAVSFVNSATVLSAIRPATMIYMSEKPSRRGAVTDENREESRLLKKIWEARENSGALKMTQATFGETYNIGKQQAVSNALNGHMAISLHVGRMFAEGLACELEDFSPRLAREAEHLAGWPFKVLTRREWRQIDQETRDEVEQRLLGALEMKKRAVSLGGGPDDYPPPQKKAA